MPDITKCTGEGCPLKESCFRFTSEASDWQSFFSEVPYDEENLSCEYYTQLYIKTGNDSE